MPTTPVDIANMALGILDEAPIETLDEDVKAARLLNLHYDLTIESELTKNTWVFAIKRDSLVGIDLQTGCGTLNWEYPVPSDYLRMLPLTYNGQTSDIPISWQREGDNLYSDQSSPRSIRYIANFNDPNDWDALFTDVVVAALAVKVALPITHKASMLETARSAYNAAVDEAVRVNAVERGSDLYRQSWASARGDQRYWRS